MTSAHCFLQCAEFLREVFELYKAGNVIAIFFYNGVASAGLFSIHKLNNLCYTKRKLVFGTVEKASYEQ